MQRIQAVTCVQLTQNQKMIHGLVSILIIVVVFILYTEIRKWKIKRQLRNFASPKQYPIIGVAGRFLGKSNDQIIETVLHIFDEVESTPAQAWFGPFLGVGIQMIRFLNFHIQIINTFGSICVI